MHTGRFTAFLCCLLLVSATAAIGGVPDTGLSTAEMRAYAGTATVSMFNLPDGSGCAFADAIAEGGGPADATITVTLVDGNSVPIQNYPFEDIWLQSAGTSGTGLVACSGGATADANTDANGETVFANPLYAGGWYTDPTQVVIAGDPLTSGDLNLRFNSPDINGDGKVDLSDAAFFTIFYYTGYDYAGDFNFDGAVDLSDASLLSAGISAHCP